MERLPATPKELIEKLNAEFPHRCPDIRMSEREVWLYAGKRALVDYLVHLAEVSKIKLEPVRPDPDDGEE